ncbi:pentatricopeptide repeat-containing protein 2, mitochondrial-like [Paramacrobiotus metropolitanus]|uniref:pentatricopeptide repeat-containing protein 2, mitochondrial-like n=1 Tax=Paramacrobiotus metropolitanus TaxID=2943436 RepID=UPI0024460723|nr:pentatricopeptide repeat-containing protein 2, mitochondrial-like [Paramacrobiotus metropolitanus]
MTMSPRFIGPTWRAVANCGMFPKNSILTTAPRNFTVSACNLLYTKEAMGLSNYEYAREKTATQLGTMKDRFKQRMDQYLSADSKSLIFTEDLKNMCYLAEDDKDLQMVNKMLKKYAKQNEQMRFGSFVFGPVLMRLHHFLDKPDEALASIQDPDLGQVYDQLTSYMVAMDLLYNHQRYDDVLKLYKAMTQRPFFAEKMPKENLVLACAACYKLGTPEAYKTAMELVKSCIDKQAPVMRKAVSFAAALALKNNDATGALELLSIPPNQSYVTIRNLRILCLVKLDRLEDVLPILRSMIEQDVGPKRIGHGFFQDVIAEVKKALETKEDKELRQEFEKTFKALEHGDQIDAKTLHEFLERPIEDYSKRPDFQGQDFNDRRLTNTSRFQPEGAPAPFRQRGYRDDYRSPSGFQQQGGSRYESGGGRFDSGGGRMGGLDGTRSGGYESGSSGRYGSYQGNRDRVGLSEQGTRYGVSQRARGGSDSAMDEGRGMRGGRAADDGYNPNREAGYRPRGQFRQPSGGAGGAQRQGLADFDD